MRHSLMIALLLSGLSSAYAQLQYGQAAQKFELCYNGFDDDANGRVDCADPVCAVTSVCQEPLEICGNGWDDDGDARIDCTDEDCANTAACLNRIEVCDDGLDNDLDGAIDCNDVDCTGVAACLSAQPCPLPEGVQGIAEGQNSGFAVAEGQTLYLDVPVTVTALMPAIEAIEVHCRVQDFGQISIGQGLQRIAASNGGVQINARVPVDITQGRLQQEAEFYRCQLKFCDSVECRVPPARANAPQSPPRFCASDSAPLVTSISGPLDHQAATQQWLNNSPSPQQRSAKKP